MGRRRGGTKASVLNQYTGQRAPLLRYDIIPLVSKPVAKVVHLLTSK